jgi:hypothetical protein
MSLDKIMDENTLNFSNNFLNIKTWMRKVINNNKSIKKLNILCYLFDL